MKQSETSRKSIPIVFLFLVSVIVVFITSASFAYDSKQAMEAADRYLKMGMYLEAIGAYRDVADHSADYTMQARSILRIGDIYSYFLNNYDMALQHYSFVARHYAGSEHAANAYFNTGMILYERNRYKDALAWFQEYLRRFPRGARRHTAQFMVEACTKPPPPAEKKKEEHRRIRPDETLRVLIRENAGKATLSSDSFYTFKEVRGGKTVARVRARELSVVESRGGGIRLDGRLLRADAIAVVPSENARVMVDGKKYRGELVFENTPQGFHVINILKVEEYLYGVLPKEMSPTWPSEALKAQAVAARTYALYQKEKNMDKSYDVYATTSSQVYGGYGAENDFATRAVNDTRGQVMLHGGRLILAYFHSNSGGATEDAKNVWTADVSYLRGVRDDFSTKASQYRWTQYLGLDTIRRSLARGGVPVGTLYSVLPTKVSPSGRVQELKIVHSGGETTLKGNHFRLKVDPKLIKSTLFTLRGDKNGIRVYGKGYGHGVGMSQWGAYEMAKSGYPYTDILRYYYADIEVK